jgi:hypothetical protein
LSAAAGIHVSDCIIVLSFIHIAQVHNHATWSITIAHSRFSKLQK